jgi:hypothetical protein
MASLISCEWIPSQEECRKGPGWMGEVMGMGMGIGSVKTAEASGKGFSLFYLCIY